ncbi:MAG: Lpg1974 family pore-forming outer membrane protein [Chlamydiae bacterium]|nr:Lpg1974 family pore-forming outer membrane protein [Chlamydiota bacterium]
MIHKRPLLLSACLTLLSAATFANFEQEDEALLDDDFDEEMTQGDEVSDASMYSFIAEEYPQMPDMPRKMHHYAIIGEMLYLKPYLGSMPWIYLENDSEYNDPISPSTTYSNVSERIKNIEMDFDFGFRVGVGFNTTWLNMENQVTWMRLHTQTSKSLSPLTSVVPSLLDNNYNQPLSYQPFWFTLGLETLGRGKLAPYIIPPGQIVSGKESTIFHWDQIDGVSKIPLNALKRATFSPLLGVRGLISEIKSNMTEVYNYYGTTPATTPPFNTTSTDLKETFNAVGLVAGLDSDINFGMGFHLSALFDAALVYGNMKTSNHFSSNVPVISQYITPQDHRAFEESYKFKPLIDLQATLSWNRNLWKNKLAFNVHVGYEVHYMPNFFEFIRTIYSGNTTYTYDLMLQGLNAGLGLSF